MLFKCSAEIKEFLGNILFSSANHNVAQSFIVRLLVIMIAHYICWIYVNSNGTIGKKIIAIFLVVCCIFSFCGVCSVCVRL